MAVYHEHLQIRLCHLSLHAPPKKKKKKIDTYDIRRIMLRKVWMMSLPNSPLHLLSWSANLS